MKDRLIAYWLLTGAFLVIAMVILGGYTRLSHSGLSMVTWKPVTGFIPPSSTAEWQVEFDKYQTSPEYIKRNYHFTLDEFKSIYWPEFLHRVLGRVLGLVFIFPFLFFIITKRLRDKKLITNVLIIFVLGGLQGLIGWYMVISGLVNIPSVSHYRLALHFCTALSLYIYIIWTVLRYLYPSIETAGAQTLKIKNGLILLMIVTIIQIIYGAFVAGLKAGLIYTTYPLMNGTFLPSVIGDTISNEGISSFTEYPALVQFIHRWFAVVVIGLVIWIIIKAKKTTLQTVQKRTLGFMLVTVLAQFLLGVFTLINSVPISLGVIHQLGAVIFLSSVTLALFFFTKPKTS